MKNETRVTATNAHTTIPLLRPFHPGQNALSLKYGKRYVTATEPALQLGLLRKKGTGSPGSIESTGSTSVSGFVTSN